VLQAIDICQCTPWHMPFFENISYCDVKSNCFEKTIDNVSMQSCNCMPECDKTDFGTIQSMKPFEIKEGAFCTDNLNKDENQMIFCKMCETTLKYHRIRILYDHFVNGGPSPDNIDEFCQYFIANHVTLVQIEMVSKSIIRSVKDKRHTFVSKLSSVGESTN